MRQTSQSTEPVKDTLDSFTHVHTYSSSPITGSHSKGGRSHHVRPTDTPGSASAGLPSFLSFCVYSLFLLGFYEILSASQLRWFALMDELCSLCERSSAEQNNAVFS